MQAVNVAETGFDIGWDFARFGRILDPAISGTVYWPDTVLDVSIFAFRNIFPIASCRSGCNCG